MSESTLRPRRSFLKSGLTSALAAAAMPAVAETAAANRQRQSPNPRHLQCRLPRHRSKPQAAQRPPSAKQLSIRAFLQAAKLACVAFPLGGVCAGTLSLGGRGQLRDWEIFNRPDKGNNPEYAFRASASEVAGSKAWRGF